MLSDMVMQSLRKMLFGDREAEKEARNAAKRTALYRKLLSSTDAFLIEHDMLPAYREAGGDLNDVELNRALVRAYELTIGRDCSAEEFMKKTGGYGMILPSVSARIASYEVELRRCKKNIERLETEEKP